MKKEIETMSEKLELSKEQKEELLINTLFDYFKDGFEKMLESQAKYASIEQYNREVRHIKQKYNYFRHKDFVAEKDRAEFEYVTYLVEVEKI